jgi:hypothetical protein
MNWSNVGLVEGGGSPVLAISHFGLIAPSEYAMREASVSYTSLAMSIRACVSVTSCSEVMPLPYAFLAEQVVDGVPLWSNPQTWNMRTVARGCSSNCHARTACQTA